MYLNFKNINNIANLKMLECIYLFFDKKNIMRNSSNYITILLITLSGISLFRFICHNNLKIKNYINQFFQKNNSSKKQNIIPSINNMQNGNKTIKKANLIQRKSISVINTITTDKKKAISNNK